jgi:hypothetical protein
LFLPLSISHPLFFSPLSLLYFLLISTPPSPLLLTTLITFHLPSPLLISPLLFSIQLLKHSLEMMVKQELASPEGAASLYERALEVSGGDSSDGIAVMAAG